MIIPCFCSSGATNQNSNCATSNDKRLSDSVGEPSKNSMDLTFELQDIFPHSSEPTDGDNNIKDSNNSVSLSEDVSHFTTHTSE